MAAWFVHSLQRSTISLLRSSSSILLVLAWRFFVRLAVVKIIYSWLKHYHSIIRIKIYSTSLIWPKQIVCYAIHKLLWLWWLNGSNGKIWCKQWELHRYICWNAHCINLEHWTKIQHNFLIGLLGDFSPEVLCIVQRKSLFVPIARLSLCSYSLNLCKIGILFCEWNTKQNVIFRKQSSQSKSPNKRFFNFYYLIIWFKCSNKKAIEKDLGPLWGNKTKVRCLEVLLNCENEKHNRV